MPYTSSCSIDARGYSVTGGGSGDKTDTSIHGARNHQGTAVSVTQTEGRRLDLSCLGKGCT